MQKSLSYFITIGLLTAIAVTAPIQSRADEKKAPTEATEKEKKPSAIPFHGKLHAVDRSAMTITLDGKEKKRTIQVTPETRIAKAGKPAKLDDAVPGEDVGGQIRRNTDGKEEAVSLRLGAKPEEAPKEKKTKKRQEK